MKKLSVPVGILKVEDAAATKRRDLANRLKQSYDSSYYESLLENCDGDMYPIFKKMMAYYTKCLNILHQDFSESRESMSEKMIVIYQTEATLIKKKIESYRDACLKEKPQEILAPFYPEFW